MTVGEHKGDSTESKRMKLHNTQRNTARHKRNAPSTYHTPAATFGNRTPRSAIRQPHTAQRHLAAAHARSAIWQPHTTATPLAASGGESAAPRWCPRRWARQRAARPAKRRALDATPAAATVVVTVLSRCASMVATVAAAIATRPHPQPIAPKLHASPCLQSLRPPTDAHSAADVHACSSMLVTRL